MSVIKALAIGDPHFQSHNVAETDLMTAQIVELILVEKPNFVVVLGDILHRHERIDLVPFKRAVDFLRKVKAVSPRTYLLVGNHDRINNQVCTGDEHCFNGLKDWPRTTVVDDIEICEEVGTDGIAYKFVFAPYVPNGALDKAFATKNLEQPLKGISGVFSHQEYTGSKINLLTKSLADTWSLSSPMNFSGHIHDYEEVQSNLIYVGMPYQNNASDQSDKTISIVEYSPTDVVGVARMESHRRVSLRIPRKFVINLTPEQLSTYVVPPNTGSVKIRIESSAAIFKELMALDNVKQLVSTHGVKIVHIDITPSRAGALQDAPKTRTSFQERIFSAVRSEDQQIQAVFRHLFT